MTQFQPPTDAPGAPHGDQTDIHSSSYTPKPWSTAAISGFVLSLLGCAGVTALLGLILGIIGIAKTRGGKRRGFGLAVTAIPLSILTGALSVLLVMGMVLVTGATAMLQKLPDVLSADSENIPVALSTLRELCSRDFNDDVSTDQLRTWWQRVAARHGRLVEAPVPSRVQSRNGLASKVWSLEGKFVNGPASIRLTLSRNGLKLAIDDIDVDGLSPRDAK